MKDQAHGIWDKWIPGVLTNHQIESLLGTAIFCHKEEQVHELRIDYSSIDLSVSEEAYELLHGPIKPFASRHVNALISGDLVKRVRAGDDGKFRLSSKRTYIFKLRERFQPSFLQNRSFFGAATAKSSVGRLDVLVRLIVDGMNCYEMFNPLTINEPTGDMYVEITPLTFNMTIAPDTAVSQLRLFYGEPSLSTVKGDELFRCIFRRSERDREWDDSLTLDLTPVTIGPSEVSAFKAKQVDQGHHAIEIGAKSSLRPEDYFEAVESEGDRLTISQNAFYILRSKERISFPKGVAAYCRPHDETIGEMRIHYAGFVHPLFGSLRDDSEGTPLIFEVRGHDFDISLTHGEKMCRLEFYRMSEDCQPECVSSEPGIGSVPDTPAPQESEFERQTIKLSPVFHEWGAPD